MLTYLSTLLRARLAKSEKGQDLAEYALLIGLIALVVLIAVTLLGVNITTVFTNIANAIGTWFTP
jgi:pilus assembly protein Flp/PilA